MGGWSAPAGRSDLRDPARIAHRNRAGAARPGDLIRNVARGCASFAPDRSTAGAPSSTARRCRPWAPAGALGERLYLAAPSQRDRGTPVPVEQGTKVPICRAERPRRAPRDGSRGQGSSSGLRIAPQNPSGGDGAAARLGHAQLLSRQVRWQPRAQPAQRPGSRCPRRRARGTGTWPYGGVAAPPFGTSTPAPVSGARRAGGLGSSGRPASVTLVLKYWAVNRPNDVMTSWAVGKKQIGERGEELGASPHRPQSGLLRGRVRF